MLKERGEILIRKQEKELMKDLILKLSYVLYKMKKRKGKIKGHEIIFNGTAIIKSSKPMLMQVTHAQKWWVTRQ
jgi:hypothetical protein